MTEHNAEQPPPEPTPLETVARLAAEAAVAAVPDHGPAVEALRQTVAGLQETLAAAAGPEGNGARLAARLTKAEALLATLAAAEPVMPAAQQLLLEDLHSRTAALERTAR